MKIEELQSNLKTIRSRSIEMKDKCEKIIDLTRDYAPDFKLIAKLIKELEHESGILIFVVGRMEE